VRGTGFQVLSVQKQVYNHLNSPLCGLFALLVAGDQHKTNQEWEKQAQREYLSQNLADRTQIHH